MYCTGIFLGLRLSYKVGYNVDTPATGSRGQTWREARGASDQRNRDVAGDAWEGGIVREPLQMATFVPREYRHNTPQDTIQIWFPFYFWRNLLFLHFILLQLSSVSDSYLQIAVNTFCVSTKWQLKVEVHTGALPKRFESMLLIQDSYYLKISHGSLEWFDLLSASKAKARMFESCLEPLEYFGIYVQNLV